MKLSKSKHDESRSNLRGIVLVECMVYIALVMVILGMGLNVYLKLLSFHRDLERNSHDITRTTKAGEIWRADIRSATAHLQIEGQADSLRLTIPIENDSIQYSFRDGTLWRQQSTEQSPQPLLTHIASCQFSKDSRTHTDAWVWDLKLKTKKKTVRIEPQFSFLAVPGSIEQSDED